MSEAIRFLGKFVFASTVALVVLTPFSRFYFSAMALESNLIFTAINHPVRLEMVPKGGLYMIYPTVRVRSEDLRVLFVEGTAVNFSLVVILALFFATPGLQPREMARGVTASLLFLSLIHVAYAYCVSYILVWDSFPYGIDAAAVDELKSVLPSVNRDFPQGFYRVCVSLFGYGTYTVREVLPFVLWANFSRKALRIGA